MPPPPPSVKLVRKRVAKLLGRRRLLLQYCTALYTFTGERRRKIPPQICGSGFTAAVQCALSTRSSNPPPPDLAKNPIYKIYDPRYIYIPISSPVRRRRPPPQWPRGQEGEVSQDQVRHGPKEGAHGPRRRLLHVKKGFTNKIQILI